MATNLEELRAECPPLTGVFASDPASRATISMERKVSAIGVTRDGTAKKYARTEIARSVASSSSVMTYYGWGGTVSDLIFTTDEPNSVTANSTVYTYSNGTYTAIASPATVVYEDMSWPSGIPEIYARQVSSDPKGRLLSRYMMNAIGHYGSQLQFFEQCGGYFSFDENVSTAVGGYPKGAVLAFYDEDTGLFRHVMSLKDNNTDNFVKNRSYIDGVSWTYCDDTALYRMHVDYGSGEDISDQLFLREGAPEWITVERNSVLNCFAVSYVDLGASEGGKLVRKDSSTGYYSPPFSKTYGSCFLDVNGAGGGCVSLTLGNWVTTNHGAYETSGSSSTWWLEYENKAQGFGTSIALGAGDQIRIRNIVTQRPLTSGEIQAAGLSNSTKAAALAKFANLAFPQIVATDQDFTRGWLTSVASLSPFVYERI